MKKSDLIAKEREKFGKWATSKKNKPVNPIIYQPIENQADVEHLRNAMAQGNYPLCMTDCEVVGINGDCGPKCPAYLRGECSDPY